MDFCAGIGAGRLGLEKNALSCVGFSEIDKQAEITYRKFFGEEEINHGDLTKIDPKKLPDFEMMIAGFPCQTFFRYRTEKRNGRRARTDNFQFDKNNACKKSEVFYFGKCERFDKSR